MSDTTHLQAVQQDLQAGRAARDKLVGDIAAHTAELSRIDATAAALAAAGDASGARTQAALRAQVAGQRQAAAAGLAAADDKLRATIGQLRTDPCDADATVPLLLLPVRIETRFAPDGRSIRVRLFPDDIHIDQLDRGLTNDERAAAILYWSAVWRASEDDAGAAWRTLVAAVGKQRATWAALAAEPGNLSTRLTDAAPVFPDTGPRTRRAAIARLLPDRFTAVAIQGAQRSTATGNPVAPEVVVGLFGDDGSAMKNVNGLTVIAGSEWLADYTEAERVGMALTLQLARPGRIDTLLVFGIRASAGAHAAAELADLLTSHRCTRGLSFVPQGTPSNNTETDRAAWQFRAAPDAPARTPPAQALDANANVLAAALGVPASVVATLDHAETREQGLAHAMNVALWGSTWDTFLEKVNRIDKAGATLSDMARELVRRFNRDCVRGRGPLPNLRVGDQPYGILPVSVMAEWDAGRDATIGGLLQLLQRVRGKWRGYLDGVPRIGAGPLDAAIQEILGASPVCVGLRVRSVLSSDMVETAGKATGAVTSDLVLEALITEMVVEEVILNASMMHPVGSLSTDSRPLALPLVDDARDADAIEAVMKGGSPTVSSVLQALVMLSWDRATRAVSKASAHGKLSDVLHLAADTMAPATRDRVSSLAATADRVDATTFFAAAMAVSAGFTQRAIPSAIEVQPVPSLARSFGELALASTTAEARVELGTFATIDWLNASGRLAELKSALADLVATARGGMEPGGMRIVVAETLDLASHRLDAWLTGVVEQRRQALRAAHPDGVTVGAYGWVEGIDPAPAAPSDGGYVASPTQAHATTAGILRSAYLSHNPDAAGSNAFAIDLSSARVRIGLDLLGGMRGGQQLGALLGYTLERRIHEAGLDRLVLSLRTIAPLTQGRLSDRGVNLDVGAIEVLAAGNVTDGVQLIEKFQGKVPNWDASRVLARLDERPKNNPYLTGPWPALTAAERGAVTAAIIAIAADMDAVADLLMAESVHQMAQGNMPRASAALDGAGTGDVPPPEPDVVSTRQDRVPFTHRLMIVTNGGAAWNATQPRAAAAPMLEAWAASRLGPPEGIVVGAGAGGALVTLDQAGICALDLVYGAADPAGLERRLRAALPSLPAGAPMFDAPAPGWAEGQRAIGDALNLAGSLRRLLVASRPASPADLGVPNQPGIRTVDAAELAAVQVRLQGASALLTARGQSLAAVLAATPDDAAALRLAVDALAAFGVALPAIADERLGSVAHLAVAEATRRVAACDAALAGPLSASALTEAGQALFGDGFWTAPAIGPAPDGDIWTAAFAPRAVTATPGEVRRYLADRSGVAAGAKQLSEALLLAEAAGVPPVLRAVQMAGVGNDAPTAWIGGLLDPAQPTTTCPMVSTLLDAPAGYDPAAATFALLVDHWVEGMPLRERRGPGADALIETRAAAGLSFNAAAASSRAPNALLLGISPDGRRWTTDRVVTLLSETLELAKLRLVTLERTNGLARVIPALYAQSVSLQGEKVLDFRFIAERAFAVSAVPAYVRDAKP